MSGISGPKIITSGCVLSLDAADKNSYPGSGTAWRDLSGNGKNLTLTNGPTFSAGNQGSIVFDGTNDYAVLNPVSAFNIYCIMPPELLHTSGSGLITYMFESLQWQIGGGKIRDDVDKLHIRVYMFVKRQSERDFPRGAIRNGIIDGTKCQSEERI